MESVKATAMVNLKIQLRVLLLKHSEGHTVDPLLHGDMLQADVPSHDIVDERIGISIPNLS